MNKIWNLEVKKLDIILAMVRDPEEAEADPGQEEEKTQNPRVNEKFP